MTRKLLPYEYELIDVLGVSKEEYLDFVAQQHIYKDIKDSNIYMTSFCAEKNYFTNYQKLLNLYFV